MLETAFLPKRVLPFALALFLVAAAARPALATTAKTSPANPKHTAAFETGKTTLTDVEQVMGYAPNDITGGADGGRTACYQYIQASQHPQSFFPVVGRAVQKADLTCCFRFRADGALAGSTSSLDRINGALKEAAAADAKTGRKIICPPPLFNSGTLAVVYGAAAPVSETAQEPPGDTRGAKARADTRSGGNQTSGDGSVSDRGKQTTGDGVHRP